MKNLKNRTSSHFFILVLIAVLTAISASLREILNSIGMSADVNVTYDNTFQDRIALNYRIQWPGFAPGSGRDRTPSRHARGLRACRGGRMTTGHPSRAGCEQHSCKKV